MLVAYHLRCLNCGNESEALEMVRECPVCRFPRRVEGTTAY